MFQKFQKFQEETFVSLDFLPAKFHEEIIVSLDFLPANPYHSS